MSDQVTLAIPAYVEKQMAPLRKEIEELKQRVKELEEKRSRKSFIARTLSGQEARHG